MRSRLDLIGLELTRGIRSRRGSAAHPYIVDNQPFIVAYAMLFLWPNPFQLSRDSWVITTADFPTSLTTLSSVIPLSLDSQTLLNNIKPVYFIPQREAHYKILRVNIVFPISSSLRGNMKTFQPVCTLPPPEPTFVAGPNVRSTLDIVWSCLGVILLSTWSILNPSVPPRIHSRTWRQRLRKTLWLVWRKGRWMLVALVAPEFILGETLELRMGARERVKEAQDIAQEDRIEWTLTHAFFAQMGGFWLKFPEDNAASSELPKRIEQFYNKQKRLFRGMGSTHWRPHKVHSTYVAQVLSRLSDIRSRENASRLCGNIWVLDAHQLYLARKFGIIFHLPKVSEDDIADRSKSDGLVKLLALAQILWLVLQLIVRAAQGKPSSQVEIMALAYAGCAAVVYGLLWSQPKDVSQPILVLAERSPSEEELVQIAEEGPGVWSSDHYAMPNYASSFTLAPRDLEWNGTMTGAIIFGAIHLIAWNFDFPTSVDRWLWRVSSLVMTGVPTLAITAKSLLKIDVSGFWFIVTSFLLVISRLVLLVETFRTLYYLEPEGYLQTWASNIPSIG